MTLYAAVTEADITPPQSILMAGCGEANRVAATIHDSLFARAVVMDNGCERVAIVSCDLYAISTAMACSVRDAIAHSIGTTTACVMICCSGSIMTPDTLSGAADIPYCDVLRRKLIGAAIQAAGALEPAHLTFGEASAQIGVPFKGSSAGSGARGEPNYAGAVLPSVPTICINGADGRLIALLFSHACAVDSRPSDSAVISADWPGAAAAHLRERFRVEFGDGGVRKDAMAVFLPSGIRDILPVQSSCWEAVIDSGRQIGDAAHAARWNAHGRQSDELAAGETRIEHVDFTAPPASIAWMRLGGITLIAFPANLSAAILCDFAQQPKQPVVCLGGVNGSVDWLSEALLTMNEVGADRCGSKPINDDWRNSVVDSVYVAILKTLGSPSQA